MNRLVAALTLMIAMTLLAPPANAASPATEEMGVERAGTYFVNQLCKAGRAHDRFNRKVWRGRKTISNAEVRRRLPEIRRHTRAVADAYFDLALALETPPAPWPADAAEAAARLARLHVTYSTRLYNASGATSAQGWSRHWRRAKAVRLGTATVRLRAKLNISSSEWHC